MFKFDDLPIKRKIMLIMIAGMSIAMGASLVVFILIDRHSSKINLLEELTILARITADRSSAAVAFGDTPRVEENLGHLAVRSSIVAACVYTEPRQIFAQYLRDIGGGRSLCELYKKGRIQIADGYLSVEESVTNRSRQLGTVVIISDLSPIVARSYIWLSIFLVMSPIGLFVVVLMTRRMQTSIVSPIEHITEVMDEVRSSNDLAMRAHSVGKDELGNLVDAFNEMLDLIEYSNTDLEIVYGELVVKSTRAEATAVELEARNEQIKEMLSSAAHDLRQPVQAMSIFIEMLELQVETETQKSLVAKTQLAILNLQEMFSEILDVSRIEHFDAATEIQSVDVSSLLKKLQTEFGALAKKKQLDLRVRATPSTINTVPGILERVIRNLVSNAINYTDTGGVLIAARPRVKGMLIEIWDTGRGIPEQKRDKIFQKYEQVDTAKRERKGYGLGLAIVKQFVEQLGYELTFKSVENRGSCFSVFIPNPVTAEVSKSSEQELDSAGPEKFQNQENYTDVLESLLRTTVFLVDDDPYIRDAVALILESWGMGVVKFSGMAELINYFDSGDFIDPDIIISDYQLGDGVTGDEAIEEIRLGVGVEVPALVITGNTSSHIHKQITDKGFEFLLKPVNSHELKEKIAEYIGEDIL